MFRFQFGDALFETLERQAGGFAQWRVIEARRLPGIVQGAGRHAAGGIAVFDEQAGVGAGQGSQVDQQIGIARTGLAARLEDQQEGRQPALDDQRLVVIDHGLLEITGEIAGRPVDQRAAAAKRKNRRQHQQANHHGDSTTSPPASAVFCIKVATVIGPTPPGTGVIQDARSLAASNSRSPRTRPPGSR